MKGKRSRNTQKTLLFYKLNFGLTAPYRLLVDGTVCNTAYSNHVNLAEQIPKLFQADVKIYTTKCAISEVEGLQARFGVSRGTSLTILKQFPVLPCFHPIAGNVKDCFSSKYKNNKEDTDRNKFCIGSQDQELREHARLQGGVPIFVMKSRVPHLEPPSEKSKMIANKKTENRALPEHSKKQIAGIKRERGDDEKKEPEKKKRKRPQAPNPLSCMKKKRKPQAQKPLEADGRKSRKRRRGKNNNDAEDIISLIKKVT